MLLWKWLILDGWKPHAVPMWLEKALLDDLRSRPESGKDLEYTSTETTNMAIDFPGMVAIDRPWMTFALDGLAVEIPCEDVGGFVNELKRLKPRHFKGDHTAGETVLLSNGDRIIATGVDEGVMYYKLHGFNRCIVLTPDLYVDLLEALEARLDEAEEKATVFWATRKLPSQILREANAVANGIPVEEVPDCGGHKNDRFHARVIKKGEA